MNLFSNLKSDNLEQTGDVLGGGGYLVDSDVYMARINLAYAIQSEKGAKGVAFEFQIAMPSGDHKEFREDIYITNQKGENFYTKDGKNYPLPGFTTVDDICLAATEQSLAAQDMEEKIFRIFDRKERKEVEKGVPAITSLHGKYVKLAILKVKEDKTKQNPQTGQYEPTGEFFESNRIDKVMHAETNQTLTEAREGKAPVFQTAWIEKNQGKIRDRSKGVQGKAGAPAAAQKSQQGTPSSLFGKK